MDFLTSIVSAMHLRSALYARFEVRTPWAVRFAPGTERARFGIMIDGDCWMVREGHEPVRLRGGDLFLALDPNALILCDDPQTPPRSCASLLEGAGPDGHVIRFGGAGAPATSSPAGSVSMPRQASLFSTYCRSCCSSGSTNNATPRFGPPWTCW